MHCCFWSTQPPHHTHSMLINLIFDLAAELPACLPACLPARPPACPPARLPACLPLPPAWQRLCQPSSDCRVSRWRLSLARSLLLLLLLLCCPRRPSPTCAAIRSSITYGSKPGACQRASILCLVDGPVLAITAIDAAGLRQEWSHGVSLFLRRPTRLSSHEHIRTNR